MNQITTLPAVPEIKLPEGPKLEGFFRSEDAVEQMIGQIETTVRAHVPDLTTAKGRDAIKSLAYNVSKSKTFLDGEGKKLVDGIKKQAEGIDKARKVIRDRLDDLRDEARKPLTDWEAAEAERQARDKEILRQISDHGLTGFEASSVIIAKGHQIKAITLPPNFGGDREAAEDTRTATMQALRNMFDTALQREKDAAELEKLREEQAARAAKEAEEAAARAAKEAEDARARAEAERVAQQERDRAEAAERARQEADERAAAEIERTKREAAEAVERAKREAQEQIERERQAAADRERARLEAEEAARIEAAEIEAQQKAEADRLAASEARRDEVREEIEAALLAMSGKATPRAIAEALLNGEIPHVQVVL